MSRTFANYVVSGAGSSVVNGTYTPYSNETYAFGQYWLQKYGSEWRMVDKNDGTVVFYITTDTPATPDLGTWVKGQNGLEPPPTVTAIQVPANPDILVSGAGSSVVNGTYEHIDFAEGKPLYKKAGTDTYIGYLGLWAIYDTDLNGNITAGYYVSYDNTITPDLATWQTESFTAGVNPPPNVTEYTPDPPHDIAVDPLTAQVNITQPTLEQTHKLSATALGATAGISEPTLSVAQYIRTPTPDCRRLRIGREDRRLVINAEDRMYIINQENRTLEVRCH